MLPIVAEILVRVLSPVCLRPIVIGGLITSTLLTLFVVPVVYTLLDDLVMRLRRGRTPAHAPLVKQSSQFRSIG